MSICLHEKELSFYKTRKRLYLQVQQGPTTMGSGQTNRLKLGLSRTILDSFCKPNLDLSLQTHEMGELELRMRSDLRGHSHAGQFVERPGT